MMRKALIPAILGSLLLIGCGAGDTTMTKDEADSIRNPVTERPAEATPGGAQPGQAGGK